MMAMVAAVEAIGGFSLGLFVGFAIGRLVDHNVIHGRQSDS